MAGIISPDDVVQFDGYEDVVDRYLLRKAPSYLEQLQGEFEPKDAGQKVQMFSTKLRGGIDFRGGEVTCWLGYSGHRKSMFTGQLALDLIAQKRRVMLASFEMPPSRSLARMARQGWAKARPTCDELAQFTHWTDGKLWMFDHLGRIEPSKVLAMCRYFADSKMGHQVVVDSMMMVCRSEESLDEQKQFMTDLVRLSQETGLHIHLVCHCRKPGSGDEPGPPTKYDLRGSTSISDQAANVITVWADQAKKRNGTFDPSLSGKPDALVTVAKQRNGAWEGACKLWFDEGSLRFCDDGTSAVEPYAGLVECAGAGVHAPQLDARSGAGAFAARDAPAYGSAIDRAP